MRITDKTLAVLHEQLDRQRIVRPTIFFNTAATETLVSMGLHETHIISPNSLTLPERVDQLDPTYMDEIRDAWIYSVDHSDETLEDRLISPKVTCLKGMFYQVHGATTQKDEEKEKIKSAKYPVPEQYSLTLPESKSLRQMVFNKFIPFPSLREMVQRLDDKLELKLRALEIYHVPAHGIAELKASIH